MDYLFNSASPHLDDHSANSYMLDYQRNSPHPVSIFVIGECYKCFTRYAIVKEPSTGAFWIALYDQMANWNTITQVASAKPICIEAKCNGVVLDILSLAAVITEDGQWLKIDKTVMAG